MTPYENLYRRKCISLVCWEEVGEARIIGLEIVQEMREEVKLIQVRMMIAQSRRKSYAYVRRRELTFD